jgi:hypothetical protein
MTTADHKGSLNSSRTFQGAGVGAWWAFACLLLAALTPVLYAASPAKAHVVSLNDLAATRPAEWLPVPIVRAAGDAFLRAAKPGLKSPSAVMRAQAAFLFGDGGNRRYAADLRPLLKDADLHVRQQAAIALCRLHDASGVDGAIFALQADRSWVRYYAVVDSGPLADSAPPTLSAAR